MSILNKNFTFFMTNDFGVKNYYMYQLVSPALSPDYIPYCSLRKISERIAFEGTASGADIDLIQELRGDKDRRKTVENAVAYLEKLMERDRPIIDQPKTENEIPYLEMDSIQAVRSMIITLRDAVRWKKYRFQAGKFIDILWTQNTFLIAKIMGDDKEIWLEPVAIYRNDDPEMKNEVKNQALPEKLLKGQHFTGDKKASDLNREIKYLEWEAWKRR